MYKKRSNNNDLISENKKLKKELEKTKNTSKLNWLKFIFGIVGAFILFIIIQRPESIINRKASQETISRERAKLLLNVIKEKDPELRKLSLEILKDAYPESDNKWLKNVEEYISTKAINEISQEAVNEYSNLVSQREKLKQELKEQLNNSNNSENDTRIRIVRSNIKLIETKIDEIVEAVKIYNINLETLQ